MGGGQIVHVVGFAAGGWFAIEVAAIPGSCSNLIRSLLIRSLLAGLFTDFGLGFD